MNDLEYARGMADTVTAFIQKKVSAEDTTGSEMHRGFQEEHLINLLIETMRVRQGQTSDWLYLKNGQGVITFTSRGMALEWADEYRRQPGRSSGKFFLGYTLDDKLLTDARGEKLYF